MKHQFFIVALLVIIAAKNSTAQGTSERQFRDPNASGNSNNKAQPPERKKNKARLPNVNSTELNSFILSHKIQAEIKVTAVNINAVRDFTRVHKHVTDPKWFKTEGGYVASFRSKEIFRKIVYDDNGRWLYNLLEYTEAQMSFEIRNMVKSRYYDDDILVIHEYEFPNNKTVYLLRMQDRQSNIVTLKVCNGEMEFITPHE